MPGPGPHLLYALGTGQVLGSTSNGRFSPHHCLTYALNAFFGPDLGSFSEWLASTLGFGQSFASRVEQFVHHPFYYVLILGLPLSLLYSWVSKFLLQKGFLDSISGENGHSSMYTWILSTGWWEGRAPINPDAVIVIGFLCTCLIFGFIYINRVKPSKSVRKQQNESWRLIWIIASLYCLWCATQIYLVNPRKPAVGEEADLGVLVFLGIYFFLPHWLCIISMNSKHYVDTAEQLPL